MRVADAVVCLLSSAPLMNDNKHFKSFGKSWFEDADVTASNAKNSVSALSRIYSLVSVIVAVRLIDTYRVLELRRQVPYHVRPQMHLPCRKKRHHVCGGGYKMMCGFLLGFARAYQDRLEIQSTTW